MTLQPLKLSVILGSVRNGRFDPTVARWFLDQIREDSRFSSEVIDLADVPVSHVLPASEDLVGTTGRTVEMLALRDRLETTDAFVIITPEYNHSFPASVKSLFDWHYTEWRAKPIGMVSYGGMAGGLRAVEQLRLVIAEMHAVSIRDTVSFTNCWDLFDELGNLHAPEGPAGAAAMLLNQLWWWGSVLRQARIAQPYANALQRSA